jgi:hypothetical protein
MDPALRFKSCVMSTMMSVTLDAWKVGDGDEDWPVSNHLYTPIWPFLRDLQRFSGRLPSRLTQHPTVTIPWHVWGPERTRWIADRDQELEDEGEVASHVNTGYIYSFPHQREGSRLFAGQVVVDFAPFELRREKARPAQPVTSLSTTARFGDFRLVTEPTVLQREHFRDPVISKLPYLVRSLDVPEASDHLVVGNTIVLLKVGSNYER